MTKLVALASVAMSLAAAQELRIIHAEYGHDQRYTDVTEMVRRSTMRGRLDLIVANQTFGFDPAPAEVKTMRIEYTVNGQPMREEYPENSRIVLPKGMPPASGGYGQDNRDHLRIISARYGVGDRTMDVTATLQRQVHDNSVLMTRVTPELMGGDPVRGRPKMLVIEYEYMGRRYRSQAPDYADVRLPEQSVVQQGGAGYDPPPPPMAPAGDLQIISAFYGSRQHMLDVGRAVAAFNQAGQVRMRVSNDTMGVDPDRGVEKMLRVEYAFNGQRDSVQVPEGTDLVLPRPGIGAVGVRQQPPPSYGSAIVILSAGYGAGNRFVDVTRILQGHQDPNGGLNVNVTNDTMGGDPNRGPDKILKIDYQFQGRTLHKEVREGDRLTLP